MLTRTQPRIRIASAADAGSLLEIYRPYVTESAVSFELEPPSITEFSRRVSRTLERTPWLLCEIGATIAGYAYASPHRERAAYQWCVEVSAYVRPDFRRAGVARALYEALFRVLMLQGFVNAYAGITLPNEPSARFHEALGFRPVGIYHQIGFKLDRWHDVAWYERALLPHQLPTGAPVPFANQDLRRRVDQLLSPSAAGSD
jgi:phosphinothricin acetyltransferase